MIATPNRPNSPRETAGFASLTRAAAQRQIR
jgi:hypothetical protein